MKNPQNEKTKKPAYLILLLREVFINMQENITKNI